MSTYRLDKVFNPATIALVGASARAGGLGRAALDNLRGGGFAGRIACINRATAKSTASPLPAGSLAPSMSSPILVVSPPRGDILGRNTLEGSGPTAASPRR